MEIYNGSYCVYVHINKINNKLYFGQTCQAVEERWRSDGSGYKPSKGDRITRFWAAIQKYGWNNFEHIVIASNLTANEADCFEELLIDKFNTTDHKNGYNMQSGGKSHSPTQETREKISRTLTGKLTGEKNPRYGIRLSDETKEKISKNHADVSGVNNPAAKPVVCLDTKTVYGATTIAAKITNTNAMGICNCCYGRSETAGGYRWRLLYDTYKKDGTVIPGAIALGVVAEEDVLNIISQGQNVQESETNCPSQIDKMTSSDGQNDPLVYKENIKEYHYKKGEELNSSLVDSHNAHPEPEAITSTIFQGIYDNVSKNRRRSLEEIEALYDIEDDEI